MIWARSFLRVVPIALLWLILICLYHPALAGPFTRKDFRDAAGIMPDGRFAFAISVTASNNQKLSHYGLVPGMLITHVHKLTKTDALFVDGTDHMIATLTGLKLGDKVFVTVFPPGASHSKDIRIYLPTEEERYAANRMEELKREARGAIRMRDQGDVFGQSFLGERLRLFSLGYFPALRYLANQHAEMLGQFMNGITGNQYPILGKLLEFGMKVGNVTKPFAGLISAYGIARMRLLGDCGEGGETVTMTTSDWTEYSNGLGVYTGQSGTTVTRDEVRIPKGFGEVLAAAGEPKVGFFASLNIAPIIQDLGCDSDIRRRMEANMLAYYHGDGPVYLYQEPKQ